MAKIIEEKESLSDQLGFSVSTTGPATLFYNAFGGFGSGSLARIGLKFGVQVALTRRLICQSFRAIGFLEGLKNLIFGCKWLQRK